MTRDLHRDPSCGLCASLETVEPLRADDLWHVRPIDPPLGVPGWMLLVSRRHCPGPAHFDGQEARPFGLVLRHLEAKRLDREPGAGALEAERAARGSGNAGAGRATGGASSTGEGIDLEEPGDELAPPTA